MDQAHQVWMAFSVWIAAAAIPLIPAIAIYRLFPGTMVSVDGPLSGLTVRAGGAFAAYVVVFLLTSMLPYKVIDLIVANASTAWTINFKQLDLVGSNGQTIRDPELLNKLQVALKPEFFTVSSGGIWAKVPETDGKLPTIVFTVPGGRGSKELDLQSASESGTDVKVNRPRREITLMSPIAVRIYEDKAAYSAAGAAPEPVAGALLPP